MDSIPVNGLTLYYDEDGEYALDLVREACERGIQIMQDSWQLNTPEECRAYIMTSWQGYLSHAAPRSWRILMAVTAPLWSARVKATWEIAGGWEQQFGSRHTFGVKPPHLLQAADSGLGKRVFVKEENIDVKVQHNTCHELTHAFTSHLKLPMWLKEGLAMVSVDLYVGKPTVKIETLDTLANASPDTSPGSYRQVRLSDPDSLVYQYVRAYWRTRYIDETQPALLKETLERRYKHRLLESKVANAYGMQAETFWHEIDAAIFAHFKRE